MSSADSSTERPYILVVEDDCAARDGLAELLRGTGYRVVCLQNGREALDHLLTSPAPRLVLLDGAMPIMDGWEFRREQQRHPRLAEIPVIMLSAEADLPRQAAAVGVATYLRKPFDPALLLAALRPFFE